MVVVGLAVFGLLHRAKPAHVVHVQEADSGVPSSATDAAVVAQAVPAVEAGAVPARDAAPPPVVPAPPVGHRPPVRTRHDAPAHVPAGQTSSVTTPIVVPTVPPPPPVEMPPAPRPVLHASLGAIDVNGALSVAEVRRAVARLLPAFERCAPGDPATVTARFSIGEHRRAEQVSTTGAIAATNACVAAAIAGLRTETAPDVGDVSVTARVQFSAAP
jgi:hypothetical protein